MESLPDSITMDILWRLPIRSISICRCVCKYLANIISDPYFIKINSSNSSIKFLLRDKSPPNRLMFVELDQHLLTSTNSDVRVPTHTFFDLKLQNIFISPRIRFHISVTLEPTTGLLLMYEVDNYSPCPWKPYHVYNPITGQDFLVHQSNMFPLEISCVYIVFCHKTGQVKLLRFLSGHDCSNNSWIEVDVHTVNGGMDPAWRRIRKFHSNLDLMEAPPLNGVYHWMDLWTSTLLSFDVVKEIFQVVPPPLDLEVDEHCLDFIFVGTLHGCLCVFREDLRSKSSVDVEVWVMNEYGNQDSWSKMYSFQKDIAWGPIRQIKCLRNGEILMTLWKWEQYWSWEDYGRGDRNNVICYNLKTNWFRYIAFSSGFALVDDKVLQLLEYPEKYRTPMKRSCLSAAVSGVDPVRSKGQYMNEIDEYYYEVFYENEIEKEIESEETEVEDIIALHKLNYSMNPIEEPKWKDNIVKGKKGKGKLRY